MKTPTWGDLKASTVANALLWPSDSCMHVTLMKAEYLGSDARSVKISPEQYERLAEFIASSFRRDGDEEIVQIPGAAYGQSDAFFEAHGVYHCLNTCNCWSGRGMQSAGIRTAWFTPLPKTVFLYLPE